ncbi:pectate lyase superfamily protein-domain-containing protein [Podospora didyma]|uniref:Pectate lyase superfamily protein-domain-containing protein n=1 Tax=Podospora didyma TaxID=330526 RepID=A0AAE0NZV7_9PEZI|nr:pectate lyase superfamily protein-domain-containing protein [Podospora didyma]
MWASTTCILLFWACLICQIPFASASYLADHAGTESFRRQPQLSPFAAAHSASSGDIAAARQIVKNAIAKIPELNKARLAKLFCNNFSLKPGTKISQAAALLAELDADPALNATSPIKKRASSFWMETISREGTVPWGNDTSYKDSTQAIQRAVDDGKRCGAKCNGATAKNAIVYFPAGKYLVSSSISIYFGTRIIGDANSWPTIVGASSFVGLGVLSTNVYVDNGGNGPDGNALEWYISTARFYSQIRNIKIDIRATPAGAYTTTIENVEIIANLATTQQGMFAENGSGGVMSDITFTGGNFGAFIWDWGWVWKSIVVNGAQVGFRLFNDTNGPMDYAREPTLLGPSVSELQVAPYSERKRNQYTDKTSGDFVHLKDEGAKGNGSTDDTAAVRNAFNKYKDGNKIIFGDAGTYIIKDTVTIPKDAKFAANGAKFNDATKPVVVFKIGNDGDVGTLGPTPGAILMEWNVLAQSAGNAALRDVHVRLGGATGTGLTPADCFKTMSDTSKCQVASMLLHATKKASGYFDSMWLWVADHMINDPLLNDALNNMDLLSVFSARGALIESQKASWLYGTASEHSVYYQYNFNGARNIFRIFLQIESPYYQPTPKPPDPFQSAVGKLPANPDYSCKGGDADVYDESWAVILKNCQNVHIGAAGTYSGFSFYTQDCIDKHANYDHNRLQQIIAIGSKNIIVSPTGSVAISSDANLAITSHPAWSHISVYDVPSIGSPHPSDDETCKAADRTYSSVEMELGEVEFWSNDGTKLNHAEDADGHQWVTIVNLTLYKFVHLAGPKEYQLAPWDFVDVPPGKARKNEATYKLDMGSFGTDKTFNVHVTTHITDSYERRVVFDLQGMGMGWRELGFPGERVSVALIITRSVEYGFVNSLQLNNVARMRSMYDMIKDRQLRQFVVPGSHDAAMSKITPDIDGGWWNLGMASDPETQSLDHYNQMRVGVRYFDMRIVSVKKGAFCYMTNIDSEPDSDRYWDINMVNTFFTKLERINNRCPPNLPRTPTFNKRPIKDFLDANQGKGCVMLITDPKRNNTAVPADKLSGFSYAARSGVTQPLRTGANPTRRY